MEEEQEDFGFCDYHEDDIYEETYEWKGCWNCHHFTPGRDFPYAFVGDYAEECKVTPRTIRRWVKTGKLEGRLFIQQRYTGNLPAPKKYHIRKGQNPMQRGNKRRE